MKPLKVLTILSISSCFVTGCGQSPIYKDARLLMGTTASVEIPLTRGIDAAKASAAALGEIERLEGILSVFLPESDISTLNRDGFLDQADPETSYLLKLAKDYNSITDGAFDITFASEKN